MISNIIYYPGVPIRPSQAVNFINQPGGVVGLSIDSCRPEDAGVYSLTVANKLGEVASKAKVEVIYTFMDILIKFSFY